MSRNQRITLVSLAVVVLIVGFVVARSASDSGGDDGTASTATAVTRTVVETTDGGTRTVETTEAVKPAGPPTVVVKDGKPVGGVKRLDFAKGGRIDFKVRSDTPGEVHFHGYDVHREIPAGGGTVRFTLPAKFDGRFVVELEATGQQIAEVQVS